jgi:hypothetical protein
MQYRIFRVEGAVAPPDASSRSSNSITASFWRTISAIASDRPQPGNSVGELYRIGIEQAVRCSRKIRTWSSRCSNSQRKASYFDQILTATGLAARTVPLEVEQG